MIDLTRGALLLQCSCPYSFLHSAAANNLSILKRKPSDLRRYITWTSQMKATFGSITSFVCSQRLFWRPLPSSSPEGGPLFACSSQIPYASASDYKILPNDWPYGISPDISHLVVWSKVRIPDQKPEGYLTPESTALVQDFVQRTFIDRLVSAQLAPDDVLWFRNWTGLQSVRGLEHIHVLVRDAPKDLLDEWIRG